MKKPFFKELSNIAAIERLALVGLSPPWPGAASQPRCSFRSGTAARAGSVPSQGLPRRATLLPRSQGQEPTFSCLQTVLGLTSTPHPPPAALPTTTKGFCSAALPRAPGKGPYGAGGLSAVSAQSPNAHRKHFKEQLLLPLPHLQARGLLARAPCWLTPC